MDMPLSDKYEYGDYFINEQADKAIDKWFEASEIHRTYTSRDYHFPRV